MPTKYWLKFLLGVAILLLASGCSSLTDAKGEANQTSAGSEGPTLSLMIGGNEMLKASDKQLSENYRKGITIYELLNGSGVATFSSDHRSILTVRKISLGPELKWELKMDGESIGEADLERTVGSSSHLVITPKSKTTEDPPQTVMLTVNGGSEQVDLYHSYLRLFTEDMTVRELLKNSSRVQLTEDNNRVLSVNDYTPLSNQVWKLKVNGKLLLDNGMDMKLKPLDELEILLTIR